MGTVTTTFLAGLEAIKRGQVKAIGSLTQLGTVRLGKRTFIQLMKLKNTGRWMRGEDLITHLGLEYYG